MTTHEESRWIANLRELRTDVAPRRDLWPVIAAHLAARPATGGERARQVSWRVVLGVAAMLAVLAMGISLGRLSLEGRAPAVALAPGGRSTAGDSAMVLSAAYRPDERFRQQREQRLRAAQARLAQLPPPSRAKVAASLAVLEQSLRDIQAAIGKDPANALLQELLVNTYQDEMRVLVDLQTAGNTGQES